MSDPPTLPPLPNPATGSANPSASYSALWGYIQPALDHIVRAPTNTPSKAPAIDVSYHMGIHTAVYNYFTASHSPAQPQPANSTAGARDGLGESARAAQTGQDFYDRLDRYFAAAATDVLLGLPDDDTTLVHYLMPAFARYRAGAGAAHRLLNYVNRQHVRRSVDEDRGWLQVKDVLDDVAAAVRARESQLKVAGKIRERRMAELSKWGAVPGADEKILERAEACAEAASSQDRVVPLASMALRRFRLEVIEPLLAVPKGKKKGKAKAKAKSKGKGGNAPNAKDRSPGPKGRLARAVKELLESKDGDAEERRRLARELADMMQTVGVQPEQPLFRRLEKFNTTGT
ncbi:hypothetical protein OF83DRAFT_1052000 [Amylostereum chailletii]|nr:hypothetical protein OF83DRAFT_1052000 [Amylostereum chailletii]